ncbi:MAG: SusD/RagB family nutrient-binding outer membrane lipoprotein, partial [Sphingobacterium sp.]
MKNQLKTLTTMIIAFGMVLSISACKDLTELNINPNGVSEEDANPNLLLPTILTGAAKRYNELSFSNLG